MQPQDKTMAALHILRNYQCCDDKCLDHTLGKCGERWKERRKFMASLALALISPWAEKRLRTPQMPVAVKRTITDLLGIDSNVGSQQPAQDSQRKRDRCSKCPRNKDRKTQTFCKICKNPICKTHGYEFSLCEDSCL